MKTRIVIALAVLAIMVASAASATTLGCTKATAGNQTTYTYTITSTEYGDLITAVHIYAPLDIGLILGNTKPAHWSFDALVDPDPEVGADIYWYVDETYAIANGGKGIFSLTVPSWTTTVNDHVVPGCFGNWGYETASWPGDVLVAFPSIAVPAGAAAAVPEPSSLLALCAGFCGILGGLRRKR